MELHSLAANVKLSEREAGRQKRTAPAARLSGSDPARPFGLTSETHLHFLVPGGLLLVLGVLVLLTLQVGRDSRLSM